MKIDKCKKVAKEVIDIEILALKKLKKSIGSSFYRAVKAIGDCQSKCILVGVGKSGHLANLIASSLSSIGASSFALQSATDVAQLGVDINGEMWRNLVQKTKVQHWYYYFKQTDS